MEFLTVESVIHQRLQELKRRIVEGVSRGMECGAAGQETAEDVEAFQELQAQVMEEGKPNGG